MDRIGEELFAEPEWQEMLLERPEVLGIDNIAHTGITVRMLIKTKPLQQWAVAREYRRRLKKALDVEGIPVGVPRLEIQQASR